ncbi:MAG TPA: hypothetical protein VNO30_22335 [Kofleriaceae bacterium]|nr:hypothetical protein [Kofleriaceae bacterium]
MTPRWPVLGPVLVLVAALPACTEPVPEAPPLDEWDQRLAERVVDYSAALRGAALKLTGELPTLAELKQVANAADDAARKAAYEGLLQQYVTGPRFARQMFRFWQDTLKMGDTPALDSAPAFLAKLTVEDRSYLEALTATSGTCPGFDPQTGAFTAGNCTNTPQTVGLLTHPGMQAHFFSNLAFRRVRWVQETFACGAFPAEVALTATDVGGVSPYTGTFPFTSIAGAATGGRVDFRDTKSVICANCHSNINHIAPLFAYYTDQGQSSQTMAVPVPLPGEPRAQEADYLPPGEGLAWRLGVPVTDMASLGAAMAADPDIASCAIARLWNFALGKPDVVDGPAQVPAATIAEHVAAFQAGGHRLRAALLDIFTSDDFIRF